MDGPATTRCHIAFRTDATATPRVVVCGGEPALITRHVSRLCAAAGVGLVTAAFCLLTVLAVESDEQAFVVTTVSAQAHGSHHTLVFWALLSFGLAAAATSVSLALRLRGGRGTVCAALVAVWAVAAVTDAFVPTTVRRTAGTHFGQVHTLLAVAGIAAQAVVAVVFLVLMRRRRGRFGAGLLLVTAVVLAGVGFVVVHGDQVAGLSERLLFAASGMWMLTSVRLSGPRPERSAGSDRSPADVLGVSARG